MRSSMSSKAGVNSAEPEGKEPFSSTRRMMRRFSSSICNWPFCSSLASASRSSWALFWSICSAGLGLGSGFCVVLVSTWGSCVVVCWRTWSTRVGSGLPGEKSLNTALVPMGTSSAGTSRCTPKATASSPAICLKRRASISENDNSRTKKHIRSDIRSAKVMTQAGILALSSSASSLMTYSPG